MRDEFYADRRDLWKWTVVLNEAADRHILYMAMHRPNPAIGVPKGVRDDVREFFIQERQELTGLRKCSRVERLSPKIVPILTL